jgi:hypothetical protein
VNRALDIATSLWDLYEPLNEPRRAVLLNHVCVAIVLDHAGVAGFTLLKPPFDRLMLPGKSPDVGALATHVIAAA